MGGKAFTLETVSSDRAVQSLNDSGTNNDEQTKLLTLLGSGIQLKVSAEGIESAEGQCLETSDVKLYEIAWKIRMCKKKIKKSEEKPKNALTNGKNGEVMNYGDGNETEVLNVYFVSVFDGNTAR